MGWLLIPFIIIILIIAVAAVRAKNTDYRMGSGMFKSSEYNLDESDDFVDKNYYDNHAFDEFIDKNSK